MDKRLPPHGQHLQYKPYDIVGEQKSKETGQNVEETQECKIQSLTPVD